MHKNKIKTMNLDFFFPHHAELRKELGCAACLYLEAPHGPPADCGPWLRIPALKGKIAFIHLC